MIRPWWVRFPPTPAKIINPYTARFDVLKPFLFAKLIIKGFCSINIVKKWLMNGQVIEIIGIPIFKFSVNCDEKLTGNELLLGESYYLNKEGLAILGMISIVTGENLTCMIAKLPK